MILRRISLRLLAAAACLAAAVGAQAGPLRICADPDNLPFSKADGPERGLYVELAELVSKRIGATPEYVWWLTHNQRRALRNTLDACDAYFGLPADADYRVRGMQRTKAFLDVSYAIVAPAALTVTQLADLRGKRIGVLHGSPPHILLATREGYTSTSFREQHEALAALGKGEVDAAILWGPSAGYENSRKLDNRWRITPVSGDGLQGQVAVAVKRGNDQLAVSIDRALEELKPEIAALAMKYGFPSARPLPLSQASARARALAEATTVHAGWRQATEQRAAPVAPPGQQFAQAVGGDTKAGRTRFNDACSHCHGTDGTSPVSERDLRRLKMRYKEGWRDTALTTIRKGRSDAGMPAWQATYNEKEIEEVLGFLATIQR